MHPRAPLSTARREACGANLQDKKCISSMDIWNHSSTSIATEGREATPIGRGAQGGSAGARRRVIFWEVAYSTSSLSRLPYFEKYLYFTSELREIGRKALRTDETSVHWDETENA